MMSPQISYEIARARENEIAAATTRAHHRDQVDSITKRRRPMTRRIAAVVVPVGACLAATATLMVSGAHANPAPNGSQTLSQRVAHETRVLEAQGYVPTSCVVGGTLMRNFHTGRTALVRW
jgi:hypothetical protein